MTGTRTIHFSNGITEFYCKDFKKRSLANGDSKIVYPDGRQKTRICATGQVTIKSRDGRILEQKIELEDI